MESRSLSLFFFVAHVRLFFYINCHWFGYKPRYWWQMPSHFWFLVYQGNPSNRLLRQIWLVWAGNYGIYGAHRFLEPKLMVMTVVTLSRVLWPQHPFIPHTDCRSFLLRFSRHLSEAYVDVSLLHFQHSLILPQFLARRNWYTPQQKSALKTPSETAQKTHGKSGIH